MKKIKYLLWFFIFWFWLLINQSFWLIVEWVTLPLTSSNFNSSSSYKYTFNYNQQTMNWSATPYVRALWYSLYYNWSTQFDYTAQFFNNTTYSCPSIYSTIQLNNSVFWESLFTWSCINWWWNSWRINIASNMPNLSWWSSFDGTNRVLIWNWNNFWQAFVYVWTLESPSYSPKYWFWWKYFNNNDWVELNQTSMNNSPLRLFFNQNVNLTSPLDWFDIATNSWSNITWFIAWQYYTENWFRYQTTYQTSPKTFWDLWWSYKKWIHFWWYGMGYSFVIDTLNQWFIRWEDLSFVSVWSNCVQSLMEIWMSDPNSWTSSWCQQVWILALKWDSYVSKNNNWSVILLSKDPSNYSQILYEQFDCAEDEIQRIFDSNYCTSIWHWYITYNNTWVVLPFNSQWVYYIWSWNAFIDLMLNKWLYWYISMTSNQYCLNSSSNQYCFWLHSTPNSKSIKELYLDWVIWWLPSITNPSDVTQQMIDNCKGPFYNTPDWLPPAYCSNYWTNFTWNCYTDFWVDSSWNIYQSLICIDWEDYISNTNTWVVDENWNYISYCSWDCDWNYIYFWELEHSFTSTWYFDNFFNSTGLFFRCPYEYTQKIVIWKNLINLINRDPFVPINCFIASYLAWKNNKLFSSWLYLVEWGPLLKSDSDLSKMLFSFFDFLLCIWLILFVSKLDKFFTK